MLVKTRGVVLKYIKYRETSIIVSIYTESLGLQTYIVNNVRSAGAKKNRIALYQPLTLLELVAYSNEKHKIQRLSETKCQHPFYTIPFNPKKTAVALFMVEVLGKTLKEQIENLPLFQFLWDSILLLDKEEYSAENFHLIFLIKLSQHLGFYTESALELNQQIQPQKNSPALNPDETVLLDHLLSANYGDLITIKNSQRVNLLKALLIFYEWHIDYFGPIKSLPVLNQVFNN